MDCSTLLDTLLNFEKVLDELALMNGESATVSKSITPDEYGLQRVKKSN
jgi:hypothetical protein